MEELELAHPGFAHHLVIENLTRQVVVILAAEALFRTLESGSDLLLVVHHLHPEASSFEASVCTKLVGDPLQDGATEASWIDRRFTADAA